MIHREAIVEVLERYNPSGIRVATIGSHSALDVCDGAVEEGFRTLVVCERGREAPYTRYFRASRDKDGRAVRGTVDETLVLGKFKDVLTEKVQTQLRDLNSVFVPNRSFTSYCDLGEIEDKFLVPLYGSRNLLRTEEREEERSYYCSSRRRSSRRPSGSPTRGTSKACRSSSCRTRSRSSSEGSSPRQHS